MNDKFVKFFQNEETIYKKKSTVLGKKDYNC